MLNSELWCPLCGRIIIFPKEIPQFRILHSALFCHKQTQNQGAEAFRALDGKAAFCPDQSIGTGYFKAEAENITTEQIITDILNNVIVP